MRKNPLMLHSFIVLAMGALTYVTPPAASSATMRSCSVSFCYSTCPANLIATCQATACGLPGVCSTGGCLASNGHRYDYTVTCGLNPE